MKKTVTSTVLLLSAALSLLLFNSCGKHAELRTFIDAEAFENRGGWVVDQQSMDVLGSAYLLAHGAGVCVEDATTTVACKPSGKYHVYVRTHNWTAPWSSKEGPGAFCVTIDGKQLPQICGTKGEEWMWQYAGQFKASGNSVKLGLHDLSGFDGRCDAICLVDHKVSTSLLPQDNEAMHKLRLKFNPQYDNPVFSKNYDFVVVGGGISGICAAVAASRLGMKVAIINDRPVFGGNNSAEVRVHLGGRIELDPYPNLGNLIKEFGHKACNNADSAEKFADSEKERILAEAGVATFAPYHAFAVEKDGNRIVAVSARNIYNGKLIRLSAPLFTDCTGDASLGVMAGAEFMEGREARDVYNESMAPERADSLHLGASLLWNSKKTDKPSTFPEFSYGLEFNDSTVNRVTKSEWYWETGLGVDMVTEVEKIRDFGLLAVYSNWSYLKNHLADNQEFVNRELDWVSYITGKRESRRLVGDYVMTENDLVDAVEHPDGTCSTSWGIDLHYYREQNSKDFPGMEFMTTAVHKYFEPYPIPYRCLYSRDISNMFMAGRDISCSHVAFGSVRVIRTCGMMGEVVGMAASLCKKNNCDPRAIYESHFDELKALMKEGVGQKGLPNDQTFCIHGCYPPVK